MKKVLVGVSCGVVAGVIDIIPMILQNLTWDANFSAFAMWVVIGFFLSVADIKMNVVVKGILVSFSVLLPSAILIGWDEPASLLPVLIMTAILGGLLGLTVDNLTEKVKES